MGQTPPRAGPLGNLVSEVSHTDSEEVDCRGLIFTTASGRSLSFLSFSRKKLDSLLFLFYGISPHSQALEKQASEEAAPAAGGL